MAGPFLSRSRWIHRPIRVPWIPWASSWQPRLQRHAFACCWRRGSLWRGWCPCSVGPWWCISSHGHGSGMSSGRSAGYGRSSVGGGSLILSWSCRRIPGAGRHFALRWRSGRLRKILEWFQMVGIKVPALDLANPSLQDWATWTMRDTKMTIGTHQEMQFHFLSF